MSANLLVGSRCAQHQPTHPPRFWHQVQVVSALKHHKDAATGCEACSAHLHQDEHLLAGAGALLPKQRITQRRTQGKTAIKLGGVSHLSSAHLHQDDHLLAGALLHKHRKDIKKHTQQKPQKDKVGVFCLQRAPAPG
jgi:hypothetical protein